MHLCNIAAEMIAENRSTKDIADILWVSPNTVKNHRANIMEKLQIDNLTDLIRMAVRLGIVMAVRPKTTKSNPTKSQNCYAHLPPRAARPLVSGEAICWPKI